MSPDAQEKCPPGLAAREGKKIMDVQERSPRPPNTQAKNCHEWWTAELQRALDILAEPRFCDLKIQIVGQCGCGYHPPTADPDKLERFAREVGLDASYSIVSRDGKSFPVPLGPPMSDDNNPKRAVQGRPARLIPVEDWSA